MDRLAAITVDVDAIGCYAAIHGQATSGPSPSVPTTRLDDPIYVDALPRLMEALDGLPVTLFLIGQDAVTHRERLQALRREGVEFASHSHRHDYRLTERPTGEIESDLAAAESAIAEVAGLPPVGFRAPGYNVAPRLLRLLAERGYRYDSSLLPAPAYCAARAAAIGAYRLLGRPSQSKVGDLRAFWGPQEPYRTTFVRYWEPHPAGRLFEIPIGVEPSSRFPVIGTSWVMLPGLARRALLSRIGRRRTFVFEMHAIDVLDPSEAPPELLARQPELRIPARTKLSRLKELFAHLADRFTPMPLKDLAERRRAT